MRSGDRYRSDGAVIALPNGCQIRYLLDAYPASTAKDADEAAARQMAIWSSPTALTLLRSSTPRCASARSRW